MARSKELAVERLVSGPTGRGICPKHLVNSGGGHGVDVLGALSSFFPGVFEARHLKRCFAH